MVNCPGCKQEFPASNIWAEVIQAKDFGAFRCRLCNRWGQ